MRQALTLSPSLPLIFSCICPIVKLVCALNQVGKCRLLGQPFLTVPLTPSHPDSQEAATHSGEPPIAIQPPGTAGTGLVRDGVWRGEGGEK